ncbi:MAG: class I SAM-dependent methyltransferase [Planctomycetota bacterium]
MAPHYEEQVISPFSSEVRFRLPGDIRRFLRAWRTDGTINRRVVLDFGCGCGNSLLLVAGQVGLAAGIDFSEGMLIQSKIRLEQAGIEVIRYNRRQGLRAVAQRVNLLKKGELTGRETVLVNANLLRLSSVHACADLGLVINSISPQNARDVHTIFHQVTASIKRDGTCIFVFPSLDTMYYLFKLVRRHKKAPPDLGAIEEPDGIYVEPEGSRQKFFAPNEIEKLFESNRWNIDLMEKVRYPWDLIKRFGWGYFPRHHRLWDWYVVGHPRDR